MVGSATLANGTAVLAMNGIAPGAHNFTATYQPGSNFVGGTFTPIAVTVQSVPVSTFTLLFPINNLQLAGQPASFAALVIPLGGGTATGTVQFMDGNTTLGSAPLAGGVAVFSTNALAAGLHAIGARAMSGRADGCRAHRRCSCRRSTQARGPRRPPRPSRPRSAHQPSINRSPSRRR